MPCGCKLPPELTPETTEWGPLVWEICHTLAEHSGQVVSPLFVEDERRLWLVFFKQLAAAIPCPTCQEHFTTYLAEHPVDVLKTMPPAQFREYFRTWFWTVHEWVNESLDKKPFPKETLTSTYAGKSVRRALRVLEGPMRRASIVSGAQMKKWIEWKSTVVKLCSVLGL
jgi:Erv1 / Alr family